jgi:hypothetical protein
MDPFEGLSHGDRQIVTMIAVGHREWRTSASQSPWPPCGEARFRGAEDGLRPEMKVSSDQYLVRPCSVWLHGASSRDPWAKI